MSLDLNLENYNYEELLSLFKINQLNSENLKKAKKIVLKTHPDKCNLDKKVFLFFSSAYKKLVSVFEFVENYKSKLDIEKYEYDYESHTEDEEGLHKLLRSDKEFSKNFNELFESTYIKNNDGYDSWLKSNDDVHSININKQDMENIRNEVRNSLVVKQEINGISSSQHYSFDDQTNYSSDIFSKFQYEDLKTAHETSLIPVLNSDKRKENYKSIGDLKYARGQQIKPLTKKESIEYLKNKQTNMEKQDTLRAYKLAKQTQEAQYINMKTEGYFNRITY